MKELVLNDKFHDSDVNHNLIQIYKYISNKDTSDDDEFLDKSKKFYRLKEGHLTIEEDKDIYEDIDVYDEITGSDLKNYIQDEFIDEKQFLVDALGATTKLKNALDEGFIKKKELKPYVKDWDSFGTTYTNDTESIPDDEITQIYSDQKTSVFKQTHIYTIGNCMI